MAKESYEQDQYLKNFHKIIIDKNGKVFDTFASMTNPTSKVYQINRKSSQSIN